MDDNPPREWWTPERVLHELTRVWVNVTTTVLDGTTRLVVDQVDWLGEVGIDIVREHRDGLLELLAADPYTNVATGGATWRLLQERIRLANRNWQKPNTVAFETLQEGALIAAQIRHPDLVVNGPNQHANGAAPHGVAPATADLKAEICKPLAPIVKWMGGKRKLLPALRQLWSPHQHRRLVEPFAGALAAALGLMPGPAMLNDLNPYLINFYSCVRDGRLPAITMEMRQQRGYFMDQRDHFNELVDAGATDGPAAAELFYYLNKACMNVGWRVNEDGHFNVNVGAPSKDTPDTVDRIIKLPDFAPYREVFSKWDFQCGDFERIELLAGDFIYVDPPYADTLDYYNAKKFTWSDQVRLVAWLARHPGPVVASGDATQERTIRLYQDAGFEITLVPMRRSVNSNGRVRGAVNEMLATRNLKGGHPGAR